MLHNTIHTWLDCKWNQMHANAISEMYGRPTVSIMDTFKHYLNSLALACEAQLDKTDEKI